MEEIKTQKIEILKCKHPDYWYKMFIGETGNQTFCQGEFFGFGESSCEFKTKEVKRGGITCPKCIELIREIKAIKL